MVVKESLLEEEVFQVRLNAVKDDAPSMMEAKRLKKKLGRGNKSGSL